MIRAALVGAGGIAQKHAFGLNTLENVKITAVIDVNRNSAEKMAHQYGAKAFDKLEDCLHLVDAVWIFTPPSFHREIAVTAMNAGKHVMSEKPISISLEDAEAIALCAEKNNVQFMTGFNMRYRYSYRKIKETIDSGKLGDILGFWSHRLGLGAGSRGGWVGYNWRTDKNLMCGMSIESLSHDIDMMRWLVGDVTSVSANTLESIQQLPGFDDNVSATLTLKNGGIGNINASWSSYISENTRGVIGTKGTMIIGGKSIWDVDRIRLLTADMENEVDEIIDNDTLDYRSYLEENREFVNCLEKGIPVPINARDGWQALKISHAILESARTRKAVVID